MITLMPSIPGEEIMQQFTCDKCKNTYDCGWSDEEAWEEANKEFPGLKEDLSDQAIVCDDCYNKIMGKIKDSP